MRDKPEKDEIKVTDRRRFSSDGEIRHDGDEISSEPAVATPPPPTAAKPAPATAPPPAAPPVRSGAPEVEPLSAEEAQAGRDAFAAAGAKLDQALDSALGAQHRPEAMQVSFETFAAELYMSAMFQLGLLHEKGQQPQVDLVGARHAIDTLSMLEEKTRGNLDENEKAILQDCLFRLRMAFVEVTNVLTRPPQPGEKGPAAK